MGDASDANPPTPRTPLGFPVEKPTTTHEAYAFACLSCGHGWEQEYEIEHRTDAEGQPYVVYRADGLQVPSPLTHPKCVNCGRTVVRIMRSGRVSTARGGWLSDVPAAGPLVVPGAHETPRGAMAGPAGEQPGASAGEKSATSGEQPGASAGEKSATSGEQPGVSAGREPETPAAREAPARERRRHLHGLTRFLHREGR